jgi:hypothetical protein
VPTATLPRATKNRRARSRRQPPPPLRLDGPIIPLDWVYETFPVEEAKLWVVQLYHGLSRFNPELVVSLNDPLGINIPVRHSLHVNGPDGTTVSVSPDCGLPVSGTIGVAYCPARAREIVRGGP